MNIDGLEIYAALKRVNVKDGDRGTVTFGPATCLCGGKLGAGGGRRQIAIEVVSTWVARHLGDGHRVTSGATAVEIDD